LVGWGWLVLVVFGGSFSMPGDRKDDTSARKNFSGNKKNDMKTRAEGVIDGGRGHATLL